ncbi:MAG: HAMP domain-containing sensor histidine kinase [Acidimicrobiia bacterium]|nr:HAMP domain-containing sensor histidine kinase [Acidimicrobiia bacterium]
MTTVVFAAAITAIALGVADWAVAALPSANPSNVWAIVGAWMLLPFGIAWYAWRRVRESNRALAERDQFMESVAHRLRTPLSSVVGYSLLLRDEPHDTRAEDLRWMVDEVATRSVEAADLLDDMLVAARLEHGGIELLPAPIDLSDETEWVLRNYLGDETVEVSYDGPRRWALADPVRVRQILRILLGNARSHGGSTLRIQIDTTGRSIQVTVADNGRGLPIGREDEMFDAFVTEAEHDDSRFPIGLGLSVASVLAARMGGSLRYRREKAWSCFDFVLPLADVSSIAYEMVPQLEFIEPLPTAVNG